MSKKAVRVVPSDGEWAVKRDGADRASSRHSTQKEAEKAARDTARRERTEVVICRRDGTIREKDSYGNDPCPPKDKEH